MGRHSHTEVPALSALHSHPTHLSPVVHTASSKACLTLSDLFHNKPPVRKKASKLNHEEVKDKNETSKEMDTSTTQPEEKSRIGPSLYVALAATHFKQHHGHTHGWCREEGASQEQEKRQCVAKLKMVHALLCCLYNMRNRDLRSRVSA